MSAIRARDDAKVDADHDRPQKRVKLDDGAGSVDAADSAVAEVKAEDATPTAKEPESLLPPSHALLNAPAPVYTSDGTMQRIMETDVGISEYIGHDVLRIEGIIKQRYVSPSFVVSCS